MLQDSFYRQIINRLKGHLDPEIFERCAAALLRDAYPALAPVPGGQDAGMDGAIADGEGEPFPLVCTTGKDVIGNLTKSLESYAHDGGKRRKVVLATSQELTPRRIRNLYRRAGELGFVMINVHEQAAMANLLRHRPDWCRELLGLTGEPAPLAVVPLTTRPLLDQELVGRDVDLDWIRDTEGDRLLVGQPGSGKTFLLHKLALSGDGLFVVSSSLQAIAEGIRAEWPQTLIVDDAQTRVQLLIDLRQMRHTLEAEYAILASCWPGDEPQVGEALGLPAPRIHHLEPLTRDEIVDVIEAAGLGGPDRLIREIVDQAEGRPGMAVTLTQLCLHGGVREVASGDAIARSWSRLLDRISAKSTKEILASFAVGGRAGMPMNQVAEVVGLVLIDVRHIAEQLAAGGVIYDVGQGCLSVRPQALREVLVRDVFFSGSLSLQVEPLIQAAPCLPDVAATLIGARVRGGAVRPSLLATTVQRSDSSRIWEEYAWLGPSETMLALAMHPEMVTALAHPALHHVPETIIPMLLNNSIGDDRFLHATPEHPLRLIEDWVHSARPATGQAVRRRKVLLQCVGGWLGSGGAQQVGLKALHSVFSPEFRSTSTDPGAGLKVNVYYGCVTLDELHDIQSLWPQMIATLNEYRIEDWHAIRDIVEEWAYPGRMLASIPAEVYDGMKAFACQMLLDVVEIAQDRPRVLHWAAEVSRQAELGLQVPLDPIFEILFPPEDLENWRSEQKRQLEAVTELARRWIHQDPATAAAEIVSIERESHCVGPQPWPRYTPNLCRELAQTAASSNEWWAAMIGAGAEPDLVEPFLRRAAEIEEPGWTVLAARCLEHPPLRGAAVFVALTLANPPEDLLTLSLEHLDGFQKMIEVACLRGQISEHVVKRLLSHEDPQIKAAVVVGEWNADPKGSVRDGLRQEWRAAAATCFGCGGSLANILRTDASLAHDWILNLIAHKRGLSIRLESVIEAAATALDLDGKRRILHNMPNSDEVAELIFHIVGEDLEAYRELLSIDVSDSLHLTPLMGDLGGTWVEKARLALDAGYQPADIVQATYGYPFSTTVYSGEESARWAEWVDRWSRLCAHPDERLRHVGEIGKQHAKHHMGVALREERHEAVYGLDEHFWQPH